MIIAARTFSITIAARWCMSAGRTYHGKTINILMCWMRIEDLVFFSFVAFRQTKITIMSLLHVERVSHWRGLVCEYIDKLNLLITRAKSDSDRWVNGVGVNGSCDERTVNILCDWLMTNRIYENMCIVCGRTRTSCHTMSSSWDALALFFPRFIQRFDEKLFGSNKINDNGYAFSRCASECGATTDEGQILSSFSK